MTTMNSNEREERQARSRRDLVALREQVENTIAVAHTEEDSEGTITAYHFKTGAIHRLLAEARKGDGPAQLTEVRGEETMKTIELDNSKLPQAMVDGAVIRDLLREHVGDCTVGQLRSRLIEYVATVRQEARAAAFEEAFAIQCIDCAEGDEPIHDAQARWFYHGQVREQVGCSASKLRLEAAANSAPKDDELDLARVRQEASDQHHE